MKSILTLLLIFTSLLSFSQSKNEQLYDAVSRHDSTKTETLLKQGADANFKMKASTFEISMLITAVMHQDTKIVKLLIEHKAEVDWRDWFKTTALMYAAHTGNKLIIDMLIAAGADPMAKDDQGNSVLSAAKESNNEIVIKQIESLQHK